MTYLFVYCEFHNKEDLSLDRIPSLNQNIWRNPVTRSGNMCASLSCYSSLKYYRGDERPMKAGDTQPSRGMGVLSKIPLRIERVDMWNMWVRVIGEEHLIYHTI